MADLEAGFAKLQGEDFEYYMQTYSIVLGRNSKKSSVDIDLSSLGGGMNISRQHARIYYDFDMKRFALDVIGKNGCFVEGRHYLPHHSPVELDSQDLLQIGEKKFYFLLPAKQPPPKVPTSNGKLNSSHKRNGKIEDGEDYPNAKRRRSQAGHENSQSKALFLVDAQSTWKNVSGITGNTTAIYTGQTAIAAEL